MQKYIKMERRRGDNLTSRDRQQDPPTGFCVRCGRELYGSRNLCYQCRKAQK